MGSLPLPRSIQEAILAKLPLEDLCRSRAVCKYWRRIAGTRSFQRRYGATIVSAKPRFLTIHGITGFILASDCFGFPGGLFEEPWIPTSRDIRIISTSRGLLLMLERGENRGARFTVVNPLTKSITALPVLYMSSGQEIAYSEILCSPDDSSYKVFTMGAMNGDELSGLLYNLKFTLPENSKVELPVPEEINEYKKPYIRVYCSTSGSWSAITSGYPRNLAMPYLLQFKPHQSLIFEEIIYCVTDTEALPRIPAQRIARFNTRTMEWNPGMITIPDNLQLMCFMVDSQGKLMLLVGNKQTMELSRASIEQDRLVIKAGINLPEEVYPEDWMMFAMMEVWGFGDSLFLHIPVKQKGCLEWDLEKLGGKPGSSSVEEEPRMHFWFFDLGCSNCFECSPLGVVPVGAFASKTLQFLKMVFYPSIRVA